MLIELRKQAKEQFKPFLAQYEEERRLHVQWLNDLEQGRQDSFTSQTFMERISVIKKTCYPAGYRLASIGELAYQLLDIFNVVASDHDFAKIMDCRVESIVYAREWFLVNVVGGDWEYEPSYGELAAICSLEPEDYSPILNAIVEAEERDLLEHSRYKNAVITLKEMVKEGLKPGVKDS